MKYFLDVYTVEDYLTFALGLALFIFILAAAFFVSAVAYNTIVETNRGILEIEENGKTTIIMEHK